ncbi:hypothetical protein ACIRPK_26680 [Kitasatospora sp. NPDC101801]|uniref:hypothetical protein n=1 Tax=Kitasatospora sp. NPDC101801 TaxID=3364103 RepID=UPI0038106F4C
MAQNIGLRGMGTEENKGSTMLAASLAGSVALLAGVGSFSFVLDSRLWHNHRAAAMAVQAGAALLAAGVSFPLAWWLLRRFNVRWWHVAVALAGMLALTAAAPSTSAYVFPEPMDRYHRELGGPGKCLNLSPYASDDAFPRAAQVTYTGQAPGRMTVTPLDRGIPPLVLDHARRGGTELLTAADPASAEILRFYGC